MLQLKCKLELSHDKRKVEAGVGAQYLQASMGPTFAAKPLATAVSSMALDLAYDWYQNVTHTFVSYRVNKGTDPQALVKVDFSEKQINLENKETGEILASVDLANAIDPTGCTVSFAG